MIAGGRYDGLMQEMGGPRPAGRRLGRGRRAAGDADGTAAAVAAAGRHRADRRRGRGRGADAGRRASPGRHQVELAFRGKPAQRLKRADRAGARLALFLGDDELARGVVKLRDLDSGVEEDVARDAILQRLLHEGAGGALRSP